MKFHEWIPSRGKRLSAMIHRSDTVPVGRPVMVFGHGFTGDKVGANQLMLNLANGLEADGLTVVRFDFAGSGDSEGEFAVDTTIKGWQQDLASVINWVKSQPMFTDSPLYLLGHSLGGLIVLTNTDGSVAGRVALAPVMHPVANFRDIILGPELWEQSVQGKVIANFYNKGFTLGPEFVRDLLAEKYEPLATAASYQAPLLIIHGTDDVAVPISGSEELYERYAGPKVFETFAADHVFVGQHGKLATVIAKWVKG